MKNFKTKYGDTFLLTIFLILTTSLLLIGGCGGGGEDNNGTTTDGDSTTPTNGEETVTSKKFNLSGSLGELLTYTIDTTAMTYSYEIVESEFDLQGTSGSGDLVQNRDGRYSPSYNPDIGLILIPNTLIVGGVKVDIGGPETFMLFAGVPALDTSYTPAEIAGTYNYIVFECDDPLDDEGACTLGHRSYYGTFEVYEDNTWKKCDEGDLGDVPCSRAPMTGNWGHEGDGIIDITFGPTDGATEIGKAMLLPSEGGGKVMVIDFKDRQDAGPGILVGVKKKDINSEDLSGKYHFNGDDGAYGHVEVYDDDTYSATNIEQDESQQTTSGRLKRNSPWEGWLTSDNNTPYVSADDNIILILPGDGVFLQTSRSSTDNDWINVGGKIP